MSQDAPTASVTDMSWAEFKPYFFGQWAQGQHVSLIGPTGQGKTTLALEILPRREYIVALGTKPRDATLAKLRRPENGGYKRIKNWDERKLQHHLLLWPTVAHEKDTAVQYRVFTRALNAIYAEGSWTVFIDEARYFCDILKMKRIIVMLLTQGRSNNITLVAGGQRPAYLPTEMYDQASHIFFWRDNDETNLKRIGGIGWLDSKAIRAAVASLPMHHVLYVNSRTGDMIRTKVELKK